MPLPAGKAGDIGAFATVRLDLESRPESVTLVRSVLSGLGSYLALDEELLDDLKTAVSEACNNVVIHAYPDGTGPLSVVLEVTPDAFDISVRDQGSGINRIAPAEHRMGVGLAVISALAHRAEFESSPGEGTEVRMSFTGARPTGTAIATRRGRSGSGRPRLQGDVVAWISPPELLGPLAGRLIRASAASAGFTVDRFPALRELTEAISSLAAGRSPEDEVGVAIEGRSRRVQLAVGPLPPSSANELAEVVGTPGAIAPLLEQVDGAPLADGELLKMTLVEPRA